MQSNFVFILDTNFPDFYKNKTNTKQWMFYVLPFPTILLIRKEWYPVIYENRPFLNNEL